MKLSQLNKPHGMSEFMLCIPLDCFATNLFGHKLTTKFKAKILRPKKTSNRLHGLSEVMLCIPSSLPKLFCCRFVRLETDRKTQDLKTSRKVLKWMKLTQLNRPHGSNG